MASSQIEIAPPSSPFGCVLRDHNQRDRFKKNNVRVTFQKNLKNLVRDHFSTCISISSSSSSPIDNFQHQNNNCSSINGDVNNNNNDDGDESLGMSPRQSRIIERWAARQAQEMVSTIERQTREAEIQALSNSQSISSRASSFLRETSPAQSDTSVELTSNVGASSLVQMWEARLNRNNSIHLNSSTSTRTNYGLSNGDNASSSIEQPSRGSENGDSGNEREEFNDWESDNTGGIDIPSALQGQDSNSTETDRIKVSDMVKRLSFVNGKPTFLPPNSSGNEQDQPSTSRKYEHSDATQKDQREDGVTLKQNMSLLPRIRARCSAFDQADQQNNLLPVGRSPRIRGRQAFNDLLMKMEREKHDELGNLIERRAVSRFPHRGRIQSMLRLRFLQRGIAIQEQQHLSLNQPRSNGPPILSITHPRERINTVVTSSTEASSSSTIYVQTNNNTRESDHSSTSSQISEDSHHQEVNTNEERVPSARSSVTYVSEVFLEEGSLSSDVTWQGRNYESNNFVTQEIEESDNEPFIRPNYDWFADISRPRIHWEDRRQTWYREMLDGNSDKEEIRQLLERRRVSTFLASDFRIEMDRLMMSRLNHQTQQSESQEDEQERMSQMMMSFLNRHSNQEESDSEDTEEEIDEEEERSLGHQYRDVNDYFDQTPSSVNLPLPSPISSWSSYRDQENGHDSDRAALSTSLRQPLQSSMNRTSLEMEMIYDLRGHMEQLHQEMSELRKSIKSCVDMQIQLQHSFKQENHSVQGAGNKSAARKGICCICYESQVDSLLYRCGHMCTCLKCAHELQWSSGKCPICRAPIVDVVRAFIDS